MTRNCRIYFYFSRAIPVWVFLIFFPHFQVIAQVKGGKVQNATTAAPVQGESYAIIFGVSNYPGLTPLKYADKDAALFRDFLATPAGGSLKPENIFYRTNENAKAADFNIDAYSWLKRKALREGDRLYIYFSGHGDAMNEDNYFLLPYDCTPNNDVNNYLATGRIEMYHVKTLFIKPLTAKKVEVLLIVDACRTNDLPGGQQGQQNFVNYVQSIAEQRQGEIIMLSTGAGQSAIESPKIGNGHGLFTWYLIAGLSGEADNDGDAADHDGKVSLAEITSYVKNHVRKDAKALFEANQVPVFLPPDKDLETIATVDSVTYKNWKLAENIRLQTSGNNAVLAMVNKKAGKKAVNEDSHPDTALIDMDNKFIAAIKAGNLTGKNSAETFYHTMSEKWPGQALTEDARYALATEYINFGQEKINLFLSGKSIVHIQRMENEFTAKRPGSADKGVPSGLSEEIGRMKTLSMTGFSQAAAIMEKALALLKTDPELLEAIYPKLYFLKAAAFDKINNISDKRQAVNLLKKAIHQDSTAAYNYLMLGHVLYDLKNDSCVMYFKKAVMLAPKWAEPENDLANYYSEKKDRKLAIEHYKAAFRLDSLDALAFQNLGVLYANDLQLDSARKYFLRALRINPCDHYANCNMASMHAGAMKKNSVDDPDFKLAERYVKKSLSCDSTFTRAYLILSGLFGKINRSDSSLYYLQMGIRRNPEDSYLYRSLGDQYLAMGDTVRSEATYSKATKVDSLDCYNYLSLSWLYRACALNGSKLMGGKKNAFNSSMAYAMRAARVDTANAYAYNMIGDINVDLGKYPQAVLSYCKAISIDSSYFDACNNLANAYYYSKQYDKAVLYYRKVIKLNAGYAFVYDNLANTYYIERDYNQAVPLYQKAVSLDPAYLNSYQKLGSIFSRLRDYKNSFLNYRKALKLDTGNAVTLNGLGNVYYNLKKYDTAIIYHSRAISRAPSNAYYLNDLAVAYEELNNNQEAIVYYKRSIEADSSNALPYANLAYVYKKTKEYDKALYYYQKVLLHYPATAFIYNSIGDVYKDLKDYPNQIQYFKKALELDSTQNYHLQDLGFAYIRAKYYGPGISCLKKVVQLYPNDTASYYNLACGYSLANDIENGMKYLKSALEKGLKQYELLLQDTDIANLRNLPGFSILLKQYFPEKTR